MPDESRKGDTAKLLDEIDQLLAQSQSLQRAITTKMQQDRANNRPVQQPLSARRPRRRRITLER